MKRSRWLPGVTARLGPDGLDVTWPFPDGERKVTMLKVEDLTWVGPDIENELDWNEMAKRARDEKEIARLWAFRRSLESGAWIMHEGPGQVWWCPKQLPCPVLQTKPWSGFGPHVLIVRDAHAGYWLEHAGADVSIWSSEAATFAQWLDGKNISIELQTALQGWGFGGDRLPADVHLPDVGETFYLETTRRLSRLGSFPRLSPPRELPAPLNESEWSPRPRAGRASVRAHGDREVLTLHELNEAVEAVFRPIRSFINPYYGTVERLYGPAAGGVWEHEVYLWVNQCDGLLSGVYRLVAGHWKKIEISRVVQDTWSERSKSAWGAAEVPQMVLSLGARIDLLAQKYRRISSQLAHFNAAIRLHEFQLEADKRGWASCWMGGGILAELPTLQGLSPLAHYPMLDMALAGKRLTTSS
jgi:hypothetical protein